MSVRMALAKLSAVAAGGALAVGGAVHVAEAPAAETKNVKSVKQVKTTKPVKYTKTVRHRTVPHRIKTVQHVVTYECEAPKQLVEHNGEQVCMEMQQFAMAPVPLPAPAPAIRSVNVARSKPAVTVRLASTPS